MLPKQHAAISSVVTAVAALTFQVPPLQFVAWVIIGTVAGVLVDVDHLVLAVLVDGNVAAAKAWLRDPVDAISNPYTFVEDIRYGRWMYVHRLLSHAAILAVLLLFTRIHWAGVPAAISLTAHIASDVVWDLSRNNYGLWR